MFNLTGTLIDVIEKPAEPAQGDKKARPAYAVMQVMGTVVDFGGTQKKKIFDVNTDDIAGAKKWIDKAVIVPVDIYGVSKGSIAVRHLKGAAITQAKVA